MDVEDGVRKGVHEDRAEKPHEPSEADQGDIVVAQPFHERRVALRLSSKPAVIDDLGDHPRLPGVRQSRRVRLVRDDHPDPSVKLPSSNRRENGLRFDPRPGDQHAEPPRHA